MVYPTTFITGASDSLKRTAQLSGTEAAAPAYVVFDRQVLCFHAYFQEAVHEKREEAYRVRKCRIYFYLEDDTAQVVEKPTKNSGIPQGMAGPRCCSCRTWALYSGSSCCLFLQELC